MSETEKTPEGFHCGRTLSERASRTEWQARQHCDNSAQPINPMLHTHLLVKDRERDEGRRRK